MSEVIWSSDGELSFRAWWQPSRLRTILVKKPVFKMRHGIRIPVAMTGVLERARFPDIVLLEARCLDVPTAVHALPARRRPRDASDTVFGVDSWPQCLGAEAAAALREGHLTAEEAFWETAFDEPHVRALCDPKLRGMSYSLQRVANGIRAQKRRADLHLSW